jgi:phosphate transport system protein
MALHYEASLQRDIDRIRSKLTEMAGLAEKALGMCVQALAERNRQHAYAVILRDQYIDELEKEVDRLCLEFLVRQQPVAGVLRFAYAAIKINLELERVGDYAESIARQSLKLIAMEQVSIPLERYQEMANLSIPMLHDAIEAFVKQDAALARKTIDIEETVDALKSRLNADLVKLFREQQMPFEALNALMMITRRLERVSDQARNICQETLYMCTGEQAKHPEAELFRILFVDEHNSCRSQMAEALATALGHPRFVFASAGVDPQPIEQKTIAFMKGKGFDLSRMAPKAFHHVPNLDHYHVVVALAKEARRAFPQSAHKLVFLDWHVPDPSRKTGTPEEIQQAYEQTCRFLQEHLKDLMDAILGETTNPK